MRSRFSFPLVELLVVIGVVALGFVAYKVNEIYGILRSPAGTHDIYIAGQPMLDKDGQIIADWIEPPDGGAGHWEIRPDAADRISAATSKSPKSPPAN